MAYTVNQGTIDGLDTTWTALLRQSATDSIFLTPAWQRLWWRHFGQGAEELVCEVRRDGEPVAIAPLYLRDGRLSLIGGTDVCDYSDFIMPAEHCTGAMDALFAYIDPLSWSTLVLHSIPATSPTLAYMRSLDARYRVEIEQEDVTPRLELPADWESYLGGLSKKDRHELRRKFRRLENNGVVKFTTVAGAATLDADVSDFLHLHRESRDDKAAFMNRAMEAFFRDTVREFVTQDIARLSFLEVDGHRAAAILAFDYGADRLLYNSGFDQAYSYLSVGLLLKAHSLREAIEAGKRTYDFLRGNEPYKYDLGAVDAPIYQCTVRRVE